jgi:hypothetical protein
MQLPHVNRVGVSGCPRAAAHKLLGVKCQPGVWCRHTPPCPALTWDSVPTVYDALSFLGCTCDSLDMPVPALFLHPT